LAGAGPRTNPGTLCRSRALASAGVALAAAKVPANADRATAERGPGGVYIESRPSQNFLIFIQALDRNFQEFLKPPSARGAGAAAYQIHRGQRRSERCHLLYSAIGPARFYREGSGYAGPSQGRLDLPRRSRRIRAIRTCSLARCNGRRSSTHIRTEASTGPSRPIRSGMGAWGFLPITGVPDCGSLIRHSPDDIQIRGNRTAAPLPRELYPFRSHPLA